MARNNYQKQVYLRNKRSLVDRGNAPESKKITSNINLIRFICNEANIAQVEEVLYEIDPHQLSAFRELIANATQHNNKLVKSFVTTEADGVQKKKFPSSISGKNRARKAVQRAEFFVRKLLTEKATRPMLKKSSALIRALLREGLKKYEQRTGLTEASDSKKRTHPEEKKNAKNNKRAKTSNNGQSEPQTSDEEDTNQDSQKDAAESGEEEEQEEFPDVPESQEEWLEAEESDDEQGQQNESSAFDGNGSGTDDGYEEEEEEGEAEEEDENDNARSSF